MTETPEEVMPAKPTIEQRLSAVERILSVIRGQQHDGYRLAESVDRLGLNAGALQEALLQVDRNQQALSQLGRELEETKRVVVPRAEHEGLEEQRRQELRAYRRAILKRIYAYSLLAAAVLLGIGVLASTYLTGVEKRQYELCVDRNESLAVQQRYLEAVVENSTNPVLQDAAQRVIDATPIPDCESLR